MNLVAARLRRDLVDQRIARLSEQLAALWRTAELAHPERPLKRGFARVTDRSGATLTGSAAARAAAELTLRFGDGAVDATVDDPASRLRRVERPRRTSYVAPQPGLFDRSEEE
jgi:exodeoxyribonuclease VII large subunit